MFGFYFKVFCNPCDFESESRKVIALDNDMGISVHHGQTIRILSLWYKVEKYRNLSGQVLKTEVRHRPRMRMPKDVIKT